MQKCKNAKMQKCKNAKMQFAKIALRKKIFTRSQALPGNATPALCLAWHLRMSHRPHNDTQGGSPLRMRSQADPWERDFSCFFWNAPC